MNAFEAIMKRMEDHRTLTWVRNAIINEPYDGAFEQVYLPRLDPRERAIATNYLQQLKDAKPK